MMPDSPSSVRAGGAFYWQTGAFSGAARNLTAVARSYSHYLYRRGVQFVFDRVMITDKLSSYAVAGRETMPGVEHRRHKGLNNRAENSHQPTRRRERIMKRFKSVRQLQRFVSIHDPITNLFYLSRHARSSADHRDLRHAAIAMWHEIAHIAAA